MNDITTYTDYHLLLKDYYEAAKVRNPLFSYQVFSRLAGIPSRGFLINVVAGRRRLPQSHAAGVARALKLSKSQFEYFENLVHYTNARSMSEKQRYFERMTSIKVTGKDAAHPHVVLKEQFQFYSQWYHGVVRSIIGLCGFRGDYERLAQQVYPPITPAQAKRSVALLEKLGFIAPDGSGDYRIADRTITTAPEVASMAIHNVHQQTLDIARKALSDLPRERRNFTGMNLGISRTAYQQVCRELEQFRNRLLELARDDANSHEEQAVYHLNFQLFSVSQPLTARSTS
jgi:uncharacterized protein (TIGR02147 family)